MQRRLTTTIIGIVVGAILLTGAVTFVLAAHAARSRTQSQLAQQATDVAAALKGEATTGRIDTNVLRILRTPFKDENSVVVIVTAAGNLREINQLRKAAVLPAGLTAADLDPTELLDGQVVSGIHGSVVFAAAPYVTPITVAGLTGTVTQVVVLTRNPNTGLQQAWPWFVLAGGLVVLVAALVGDRLGRRISRPLRDAEAATRRIAAGDLSAQVPLPDHAYTELASLAHSINTMSDNLARAKGMERHFLLSVSHDLRTPLTSIRASPRPSPKGRRRTTRERPR